jgi:hypothetical protein
VVHIPRVQSPSDEETRFYPIDTGGGGAGARGRGQRQRGEFSSPSLAQSSDGSLHIVYSVLREAVQYVRIHESWITHGPTSVGAFRGDYHVEPEPEQEPEREQVQGADGGG